MTKDVSTRWFEPACEKFIWLDIIWKEQSELTNQIKHLWRDLEMVVHRWSPSILVESERICRVRRRKRSPQFHGIKARRTGSYRCVIFLSQNFWSLISLEPQIQLLWTWTSTSVQQASLCPSHHRNPTHISASVPVKPVHCSCSIDTTWLCCLNRTWESASATRTGTRDPFLWVHLIIVWLVFSNSGKSFIKSKYLKKNYKS